MTRPSQERSERGVPDSLETITRREALRRAALVLGGTLATPLAGGVLAGCEARRVPAGAWQPRVFSADQVELVAAVVEHILPETDTPGARALGVHQFIDALVAEAYSARARASFLTGLAGIDARAQQQSGKTFVRSTPGEQHALLERLDGEAFASNAVPGPFAFFRTLKQLTLVGYYTSEIGATRELRHAPVPGHYDGCVPLAEIGGTWAV